MKRPDFTRLAVALALAASCISPASADDKTKDNAADKAPDKASDKTKPAQPSTLPAKPASGPVLSDKSWKGDPNVNLTEAYGYFIWQDDNGWHVRWTTKGKKMRFEGTIQADGKIQQFEAVSVDDKDKIRKTSEGTITFSTSTQSGRDGVNFRLADDVQMIRFDLQIDGQRAVTDRVKLGSRKKNPPGVPFTIDRKDEAKKKK